MLPHPAIAIVMMRSCDPYVACGCCIQNGELHSGRRKVLSHSPDGVRRVLKPCRCDWEDRSKAPSQQSRAVFIRQKPSGRAVDTGLPATEGSVGRAKTHHLRSTVILMEAFQTPLQPSHVAG